MSYVYFVPAPTTIEALKKMYYSLARKFHPDLGGDVRVMQEVNEEYAKIFSEIEKKKQWTYERKENNYTQNNTSNEKKENANDYIRTINKIIGLEGINIEICGTWIWVTGKNIYKHYEAIKGAGFRYSKNKKAWYIYFEPWTKKGNAPLTMDAIRFHYGSKVVK